MISIKKPVVKLSFPAEPDSFKKFTAIDVVDIYQRIEFMNMEDGMSIAEYMLHGSQAKPTIAEWFKYDDAYLGSLMLCVEIHHVNDAHGMSQSVAYHHPYLMICKNVSRGIGNVFAERIS